MRAADMRSFSAKQVFASLSGQRLKALKDSGLVRMNGKRGRLEWVGGTPQPIHARRVVEAGNALQENERKARERKGNVRVRTKPAKKVAPKKAKPVKRAKLKAARKRTIPKVARRRVKPSIWNLWGLLTRKF